MQTKGLGVLYQAFFICVIIFSNIGLWLIIVQSVVSSLKRKKIISLIHK